ELPLDCGLVGIECFGLAGEERERVFGGEPRRDERLVDAVARDGVERTRRVADDKSAAARQHIARPPHRQAVAANVGEVAELEAVVLAEDLQVAPEVRALVTPAADPDVHVITLRKDPAVAPRNGAELEDEHAPPAIRRKALVRKISLESDAVHDRPAEPEGAGGRSVGSIRAADRPDLDPFAVDPQRGIRLDLDVDAVAEL